MTGAAERQREQAIAAAWTVTAVVFGAIAALAAGLGALLWRATHGAALLLGSLALVALVLSLVARRRGRARGSRSA